MLSFRSLISLLPLVGVALAQSSSYTDSGITFQGITESVHGVTYGFVLPPAGSTGSLATEFIGEIIAPIANKWVGIALGGQMADNLLLVAWPNANSIVFSPRYTTGYVQPTVYAGPTITTLQSSVNATAWKWIYRCQNCTSWQGGSLDTTGSPVVAWVISNEAVDTPSNAASNFNEHDDFGFWGEIFSSANSPNYSSYLGSSSSTTTSKSSTTTSKSSTTTSSKSTTTTSSKSTTTTTSTKTTSTTTSSTKTSTTTSSGATQTKYGQCGGNGYTGPTTCAPPATCSAVSPPYYYQCL
ncbi:CBD9-like protein [Sistotremastrum niveocremeum HHB9708]|uniref:CBD9-like protein n=1 Tax=Sistotremastrum niveocremeum HHB9708 TaxID=1314777 RepID=A0A164RHD5_9AGAM|nr:CBD9-like protein [Sistotremastrum niveocremeum HHB9708]